MTEPQDSRGNWTSASSAQADKDCPGRFLAQRELPDPPVSEDADSGTVVHELWTTGKAHREATNEESDKAAELASREMEVAAAAGFDLSKSSRFVEKRLWHPFDFANGSFRFQHSGRFDVAIWNVVNSGRVLALDGKSGWLEVPPPNSNQQLRDIAVLLWLTLSPQEISVNILKPFGPQDASCVYTADDLRRSLREMEERVRASNDPKSPRIAGSEQCKFCRAAYWGKCPEHQAWLAGALPAASLPLPMTPASEWTPAQRTIFCERWKAAERWGGERWVEIKNLLQADPSSVPGYGLREGRTIQTITKPQEVFNRFCQLGGKTDAFMRAVKIGKGDLKDEVRAVTDLKGKALDAQVDSLLDGCTVSLKSATTIEKIK